MPSPVPLPIATKLSVNYGNVSLNFNGTIRAEGTVISRLLRYVPQYGGEDAEYVTEQCDIQLSAPNGTALIGAINAINLAMSAASRSVTNTSSPAGSLLYNVANLADRIPYGNGGTMVSYIRKGKVIYSDGMYDYPTWSIPHANITVEWTRTNYWEEYAAVNLPMANRNEGTNLAGTNYTIELSNSNFGGTTGIANSNIISIPYNFVRGDMPTPIRVSIYPRNMYATNKIAKVYIGNHIVSGGAALLGTPLYDFYASKLFRSGEDTSVGGTAADTTCSGSAYGVGTAGTAEAPLFRWSISDQDIRDVFREDIFHVIARFQGTAGIASTKFRWNVMMGAGTVWSGPQFRLNVGTELMQDMGAINVPPISDYLSGNYPTAVTLMAQTSAGAATIGLDYIEFLGGNYAQLSAVPGAAMGTESTLYFGNAPNRFSMSRNTVNYAYKDWVYKGDDAIYISPVFGQHLSILVQGSAGTFAPYNGTVSVSATYYPRYRLP